MKEETHPYDLICRYFANEASTEELRELDALLQSKQDVRDIYADLSLQSYAVAREIDERTIETGQDAGALRKWMKPVLTAAAGIAMASIFFLFKPAPDVSTPAAIIQIKEPIRVTELVGRVELETQDNWKSGGQIRTMDEGSAAELSFADESKFSLAGNSTAEITLGEKKQISVTQGLVALDVTKQPVGSPLMVMTPQAEMTVLGTSFRVEAKKKSTKLMVSEGSVDFKRIADGQSVRVAAGEFSHINQFGANNALPLLQVREIPKIPSSWEIDFRRPLPEGFLKRGQLIFDAQGNCLGVRSTRDHLESDGIGSHPARNTNEDALFRLKPGSVLKVRLKMEIPSWINFIVKYLPSDPASIRHRVVLYQKNSWWKDLQPGEWRTIEIPLNNPKKVSNRLANPEDALVEWRALSFYIGAGNERRGIMIEKMWLE